jgi:hypothetical protein
MVMIAQGLLVNNSFLSVKSWRRVDTSCKNPDSSSYESKANCLRYTTSKIDKAAMQEFNERIVAELCKWKGNLPQILQIDLNDHVSPYTPHVLLLQ